MASVKSVLVFLISLTFLSEYFGKQIVKLKNRKKNRAILYNRHSISYIKYDALVK